MWPICLKLEGKPISALVNFFLSPFPDLVLPDDLRSNEEEEATGIDAPGAGAGLPGALAATWLLVSLFCTLLKKIAASPSSAKDNPTI